MYYNLRYIIFSAALFSTADQAASMTNNIFYDYSNSYYFNCSLFSNIEKPCTIVGENHFDFSMPNSKILPPQMTIVRGEATETITYNVSWFGKVPEGVDNGGSMSISTTYNTNTLHVDAIISPDGFSVSENFSPEIEFSHKVVPLAGESGSFVFSQTSSNYFERADFESLLAFSDNRGPKFQYYSYHYFEFTNELNYGASAEAFVSFSRITDVRLTYGYIPEPQQWALLLFGFGAIGMMLRTRSESGVSIQ